MEKRGIPEKWTGWARTALEHCIYSIKGKRVTRPRPRFQLWAVCRQQPDEREPLATEEKIDIEIPGYRVLRRIGRGGMASVYLALQESMEREVALKVMLPSLSAVDPSFGERFVREARIVAKLSHPNINAVYDVGVAGLYHYISMEYIPGGDLKSRIRKGMTPSAVLAVARQVASALAFAHSRGYVHRDVKPENVLFRENGTAVLTDFGIAKANDVAGRMTTTGTIMGTPHYMSPEQAKGYAIDKRSDLYSLGVMIYEMLTATLPYTGDSAVSIALQHVTEPIPKLPPLLQVYQPLLEKFLAKDPARRFQSGDEAIAAMEAFAGGTVPPTLVKPAAVERTVVLGRAPAKTRSVAAGRTKRRGIGLAAVLLVPLLAVGAYYVRHQPAARLPVAPAPVADAPAPAATFTEPDPRAARIARLLSDAADAARAGRYFEPADSAAVPKYRRVLELEPDNAQARRALNEIAGRFIAQAERAIESGELDQAEALLQQAEAADSAHPMLFSRRLALREYREKRIARARVAARLEREAEVRRKPVPAPAIQPAAEPARPAIAAVEDVQARERRVREQKLQALLSRFQDLVAPGALSATRAGLAQELMGEAMRLAPDDERVRALADRVADAYLRLAMARAEAKNYEEAEALIRRGLELNPNHRQLHRLQKEVTEKKNPRPQPFGSF